MQESTDKVRVMTWISTPRQLLEAPFVSSGIASPACSLDDVRSGRINSVAAANARARSLLTNWAANPPHELRTIPGNISAGRHLGQHLLPIKESGSRGGAKDPGADPL